MKYFISLLTFLMVITFSNAQEISYGVSLGTNSYDLDGNDLKTLSKRIGFNIGGYFDYKINNSIGVKGNLFISSNEDRFLFKGQENPDGSRVSIDIKSSFLIFSPQLKYDLDSNYGKGFYLLGGPRLSILLNSKNASNSDSIEDFYKGMNFGGQLGFGTTFLKHFGIEILGDIGLSNILDSDDIDIKTIGAYATLNINLESIINN